MSTPKPASDPELSLVIPCLNEAGNAELVVQRLAEIARESNVDFEVIFVDGGSRDDTAERLLAGIETYGLAAQVLVTTERRGYGFDIMSGLARARGAVLAWTHADMQTDPQDVLVALARYRLASEKGGDVFVKGKRMKRPFLDAFFTLGMQMFTLAAIGMSINDINAQPKLFSRRFFQEQLRDRAPDDFSLDLYALYRARGNQIPVLTVPVHFNDRQFGEAKGGGGDLMMKIALARRTVKYILKLRSERL